MSILEKDIADVLFDKISLFIYEKMKQKSRKSLEYEKKTFIERNTVIVQVNGDVIYDSSTDGVMNDDLYNALISYGVKQDVETNENSAPLIYNINPNITSIIPQQ